MILLLYAAIILVGIGFDQMTKYLAVANLEIDNSPDVKVWEGVFHIRCISNDGAAFGMLDDHRWVFMSVSIIVIAVVLIFMTVKRKSIPISLGIALSLIVSGGIGNMIDRIALGYVIDFIYFVPIDFPCFNVADSLVCIGAGMMFLCVLLLDDGKKKKDTAAEPVADTAADSAGEVSDGIVTRTAEAEDGAFSVSTEQGAETKSEQSTVAADTERGEGGGE